MQVNPFPFKRPVRVELLPLIDMFFLVLTFFIFGVFSMTMQQGILVNLPNAATAAPTNKETVTVSVAPDGAVFLNAQPVTPERLAEGLRQERAAHPEALVLIHADRTAAHGAVITALDAVRAAGFQRVSFQTEAVE